MTTTRPNYYYISQKCDRFCNKTLFYSLGTCPGRFMHAYTILQYAIVINNVGSGFRIPKVIGYETSSKLLNVSKLQFPCV